MIPLIVLLCLIIFIILWVIFTPLIVRVSNEDNIYEIRQRGTFLMKAEFNEGFRFHFYVFGFQIPKRTKREKHKPVSTKKQKKQHVFKKSFSKWNTFLGDLRKAVSVKRLVLDIDTGDVVLNAQIFPVLFLLNINQVTLSINFVGRVFVEFIAYIYLHKALWAFINLKLKH
jgi:hypothetical protein